MGNWIKTYVYLSAKKKNWNLCIDFFFHKVNFHALFVASTLENWILIMKTKVPYPYLCLKISFIVSTFLLFWLLFKNPLKIHSFCITGNFLQITVKWGKPNMFGRKNPAPLLITLFLISIMFGISGLENPAFESPIFFLKPNLQCLLFWWKTKTSKHISCTFEEVHGFTIRGFLGTWKSRAGS